MAVTMTADQYQTLIDTLRGGGDGGAAGTAGAATREGPFLECPPPQEKICLQMEFLKILHNFLKCNDLHVYTCSLFYTF